jgi:hypothetical protein
MRKMVQDMLAPVYKNLKGVTLNQQELQSVISQVRRSSETLELNNKQLAAHIERSPFLEKSIPRLNENQ